MKTINYDVLILGGGPAGTATALALRKHNPDLSVALVERSAYDKVRIGETLPPLAQPLLAQLGVWDRFVRVQHMPSYGTTSAWGTNELQDNEFIYSPYSQGWHLDRRKFDAMLANEATTRDVTLYTGTSVMAYQKSDPDGWRLAMRTQKKQSGFLQAAFVVDATGRLAAFARRQGAGKIILDKLVGVFVFFEVDTSLIDSYTLVEAWQDGWWYSALLPDSQMVVACMSDADIVKAYGLKSPDQWFEALDGTRHIKGRLTNARPRTTPRIYAAHSHHLNRTTGESWLAVGDAASTFDPLSSQGIFKALRSGIFAAYAICDYLNGDMRALRKYEMLVKEEFGAYLDTLRGYYGQEQRWPDSVFWQRRVGHITAHIHSD